jgi:hypothetical protein
MAGHNTLQAKDWITDAYLLTVNGQLKTPHHRLQCELRVNMTDCRNMANSHYLNNLGYRGCLKNSERFVLRPISAFGNLER